jgi:hypothetical protein
MFTVCTHQRQQRLPRVSSIRAGLVAPEKSDDWTGMVDGLARFAAAAAASRRSPRSSFARGTTTTAPPSGDWPLGRTSAPPSSPVLQKGTRALRRAARRVVSSPSSTTPGEGLGYEMTHELGHGVVVKAHWKATRQSSRGTGRRRLVQRAAPTTSGARRSRRRCREPDPAEPARLTRDDWDKSDVVEQPMAENLVTSASKDLPETIAALVNRPDAVKGSLAAPLRIRGQAYCGVANGDARDSMN